MKYKAKFISLAHSIRFNKYLWLLNALLLAAAAWMLTPARAAWAACGDTNPRTVLCVDRNATGTATGLSWTDAFTNIQDALAVTHAISTTDYEIWVAEGLYYPDEGVGTIANSETMSFTLRTNNVQLYGGFAGDETTRDQRDWETHLTVLSGDIDHDAGGADTADNGVVTDTAHITGTNAHHVLWLDGVNEGPITETTVIDGFTITAGQADGNGGGLYCDGADYGHECSPVLTHITFSGNHANGNGGGMYNNGSRGVSSPALTNVTFSGNRANGNGGGVYNDGSIGVSSPALTNVTLSNNQADKGGGMYNDGYGFKSGLSNPVLTNVILWGNTANDNGNQLYNFSSTPVLSYTLIQSDIYDVYGGGTTYGDGILTDNPRFVDAAAGDLRLQPGSPAAEAGDNSAVAGVTTDLDGNPRIQGLAVDMGAYEAAPTPHLGLTKSFTPVAAVPYHGVFTATLILVNWGAISDTHVLLTDTLPSEVDFGTFSGKDHGASVVNDELIWSGIVTNSHTLTWTFTLIHTGNYAEQIVNTVELSSTLQRESALAHFLVEESANLDRLYVDADNIAGGDGMTWTTAYRYLQEALDRVNYHPGHEYEIWVAEGIYYPDEGSSYTDNNENESFTLRTNNVQLYGGFAGDETTRDQRDWETHLTVLSGDIDHDAGGADTADNGVVTDTAHITGTNAHHVLWLDGVNEGPITETTVIDGFTITAGQADGNQDNSHGGGLYCDSTGSSHECSPVLTHITFSGNHANGNGGGIYNYNSLSDNSPALIHVTFSGNRANGNGGGMYNYSYRGYNNPVLTHVTFSDNQADKGGGMYNGNYWTGNSNSVLTHVIFSSNQADEGGGMYNYSRGNSFLGWSYSNPVLTHVVFNGNQADNGGGMYNYNDSIGSGSDSKPVLTNVIFSGNQAQNDGGGIYNGSLRGEPSKLSLTNVTISGNRAVRGGGICNISNNYYNSSRVGLTNVILWANTAITGTQLYNKYATSHLRYTLVQSGTNDIFGGGTTYGDGIITSDPQFITPITATVAPTTAGNYHLQASSPAIDAGNNDAINAASVTIDLDGTPRIVGGTVDLGAYEAASLVGISKSVTPTTEVAYHGTVTYTVNLHNNGVFNDASVRLTDTLPITQVAFAGWVISPTGTTLAHGNAADSVITWQGMVIAGETLTWTWMATHIGSYTDIVTNTAEFSSTLQADTDDAVFMVIGPPEITVTPLHLAFGTQSVHAGATLSQTVSITNDGDSDLHISAVTTTGDISAFTLTDSGESILTPGSVRTIEAAFDPTITGAKIVTLTIRSNDSDEPTVEVTMHGTGTVPPTISNIADQVTVINTPISFTFTVSDTDDPLDTLWLYAASSNLALVNGGLNDTLMLGEGITITGSGTERILHITPQAGITGTTTITVTVNDGTNIAFDTFVLTVEDNTPPEFTSEPILTATVGNPYTYTITAYDANDDPLNVTTTAVLPDWLTLVDHSKAPLPQNGFATLSGTPVMTGSYNVALEISDGMDHDTQNFTIVVAAAPEQNQPVYLPLILRTSEG